MNVKFTLRAESEAEAKTRWWRRNRQASPDLFDDEGVRSTDRRRDQSYRRHPTKPTRKYAAMITSGSAAIAIGHDVRVAVGSGLGC